jgi:signal peptidase I
VRSFAAFTFVAVTLMLAGCGAGKTAQPAITYVTLPTVTVSVPSSSMEPTLHCAQPGPGCQSSIGDAVVVQPAGASVLKRGDIVLFNTPPLALARCGAGGRYLKRVIGLPGDIWAEKAGYVYVNGKKPDEPYVTANDRDFQTHTMADIPPGGLTRIPQDDYLVMGDNRAQSCDSRVWGLVLGASVIGKVVKIIRAR